MRKKRKILPIAAAGVLLISVIGGTTAYFLSHEDIDNTIIVGNNEISIIEDFEAPTDLTAGLNTYKKKISIENTGTTNAFVRAYVNFSDSDVAENSSIATSAPEKALVSDSDTFSDISDKLIDAGYISYSDFYNESSPVNGWQYISSDTDVTLGGYFYYETPIAPGEETTELIDTIATYFETDADIKNYNVIVYAESVQTINKDGILDYGTDYISAWTDFLARK